VTLRDLRVTLRVTIGRHETIPGGTATRAKRVIAAARTRSVERLDDDVVVITSE
jgi:hypothetical protein